MSKIVYLAHTERPEQTVTFSVNGTRYSYKFPIPPQLEGTLYLIRKVSIGKAFAYAKRVGKLMEPAI